MEPRALFHVPFEGVPHEVAHLLRVLVAQQADVVEVIVDGELLVRWLQVPFQLVRGAVGRPLDGEPVDARGRGREDDSNHLTRPSAPRGLRARRCERTGCGHR